LLYSILTSMTNPVAKLAVHFNVLIFYMLDITECWLILYNWLAEIQMYVRNCPMLPILLFLASDHFTVGQWVDADYDCVITKQSYHQLF
jgi:hypothetical protein